jgi:ribose transport system ATP-binding protein
MSNGNVGNPENGRRPPVLSLQGISKTFGGVHALQGVGLEILRGEVHGLLGENGSGKSTLIKILAGFHSPDDGTLEVNGSQVPLPLSPGEFRRLGMTFVHQDLGLIPSMSVLENFRITDWGRETKWRLSWRRERREALRSLESFDVNLQLDTPVAELRPVDRALLAIVRAIEPILGREGGGSSPPGLLVLDEPTVFLPRSGIDQLFNLVRQIAASGSSVLFVSHDLSEVREITSRVTVLRDGRVHGTVVTSEASDDELVEMIIGRRLAKLELERPSPTDAEIALRLTDVEAENLHALSMSVQRGEVLGLTGLAGSGFEDVPYAMFGAQAVNSGHLQIGEHEYDLRRMNPTAAISAGMALLPADRQRDASVGSLSILDNITLRALDVFRLWYGLNRRAMRAESTRLLKEYEVRPNDPLLDYSALSGGNQQKALLAKWLQTKPPVLLLHEPTQGVDVGSRQQIFKMVRRAAAEGASVLCASSDAEQLAAICDHVLIFGRGSVVQELRAGDITKERITEQCYNSLARISVSTYDGD